MAVGLIVCMVVCRSKTVYLHLLCHYNILTIECDDARNTGGRMCSFTRVIS